MPRDVTPEDDRRTLPKQRAEGVGTGASRSPVTLDQWDIGQQVRRLDREHDAGSGGTIQIGGMHTLEVLDPMGYRHRSRRVMRSRARRTAASPIACTVEAMPAATAISIAVRTSDSAVIGIPRSRDPS